MANNNNNNQLVAEDDDPTVELELQGIREAILEGDAKTLDTEHRKSGEENARPSVAELQSTLKKSNETIELLQFDFEKVHSKWVGLESEVKAREQQTESLNAKLATTEEAVSRKDRLIKKRDRKIKLLKAEIRQRDDEQRRLADRFENQQTSLHDALRKTEDVIPPMSWDKDFPESELHVRLERMTDYADSMRQQLQDLMEAHSASEREIDHLSSALESAARKNVDLAEDNAQSEAEAETLREKLASIEARHAEEIRTLRFELTEAQNTAVEVETMNGELASTLVDAQEFKVELEKMLTHSAKQSDSRINALKKEVSKLERHAKSLERKLASKSEAITVLLGELARKPDAKEDSLDIEEIVQSEVDLEQADPEATTGSNKTVNPDRMSRVLIGAVGDQILRFPLFKDKLTIGRTKDNDIQLDAAYISRRHAIVETADSKVRIIDWGSKNGVHVNSQRIDEHQLSHGDKIVIGNARFRYEEHKKKDS